MTSEGARSRKRVRAQVSGNLVPVTLRMTARDRDQMERVARIHGASLSEYLRDVIEERGTQSNLTQRLEKIEGQLNDLAERDHRDPQNPLIASQLVSEVSSLRDLMAATAGNVEQFTSLIQTSFEQLFQAFFKLQTYIEHMLKAQGGRK